MPRYYVFVMTWAVLFGVALVIARLPYGVHARLATNIVVGCCGAWLIHWYQQRSL